MSRTVAASALLVALLLTSLQAGAAPMPSCTITGTPGADVLRGTARADVLCGLGGDDTLIAGGGNDILRGGAGHDRLEGGAGRDVLQGGPGNDVLPKVDGPDVADGGTGNDRLVASGSGFASGRIAGGAGNDTLLGSKANDRIEGGYGRDVIRPGDGIDAVFAGPGNDTIIGSPKATLAGTVSTTKWNAGPGDDLIIGSVQSEKVNAGAGNDRIVTGSGLDKVYGGAGNDRIIGGSIQYRPWSTDSTRLEGGPGDDVITGGTGRDRLIGGAGNDRLRGGGGLDRLDGGNGNDALSGGEGTIGSFFDGGAGADVINGTAHGDTIAGGGENDTIRAGGGNDRVDGGTGADLLAGGAGRDDVSYASRVTPVSLTLDGVANDGHSGEGDSISGDFESATGGSGDDRIAGGDADDDLNGGAGNDTLQGNAGNDDLDGGLGNDILDGGPGANPCRTGEGEDTILNRAACEDVTPPRLRSLTISPSVSTVDSGQTLYVELRVTDDLAGVASATLNFRAPSTQQSTGAYVTFRRSGTELDGTYFGLAALPRYAQLGTWTLSHVTLSDRTGNYITGIETEPMRVPPPREDLPGIQPIPFGYTNIPPAFNLAAAGFARTFANLVSHAHAPDEFEPNDTSDAPRVIAAPEPGSSSLLLGTLHSGTDEDWFQFSRTCDGSKSGASFGVGPLHASTPGGPTVKVDFQGSHYCSETDAGQVKTMNFSVKAIEPGTVDRYAVSVSLGS